MQIKSVKRYRHGSYDPTRWEVSRNPVKEEANFHGNAEIIINHFGQIHSFTLSRRRTELGLNDDKWELLQ
jgi:hypothetical protein